MKPVKLYINNEYVPCCISNNKFITNNIIYNIKNIINDEYYEIDCKDNNIFIFYNKYNNIYWLVDRNKQYVFGNNKDSNKNCIAENYGCVHDKDFKSVCYRLPRNGSTSINRTYEAYNTSNYFKITGNWNNWDNENYYITFNNFKNSEYFNSAIKYFVWRDPIERFLSQLIRSYAIKFYNNNSFYKDVFKDKLSSMYFICQCLEINNYYNWKDNEYHIVTQNDKLNSIINSPEDVDYMVKLENLPEFFENKLKMKYIFCNVNYTNFNKLIENHKLTVSDIPTDIFESLKNTLKCDYDLFNQYRTKLYII